MIMMNLTEMIKIYKMTQPKLKEYLYNELIKLYGKNNVVKTNESDGFVFANGTFNVLLVAHLDTVHEKSPQTFMYDENDEILSSPEGIGGDDRNGVITILEIIKKYKCSVLFCETEETGGIGAQCFTDNINTLRHTFNLDFNYIIEFDRANSNDAVFYDCDNPEFESFITKNYFKTVAGSFSDISIIAPALGIAAVNLSTAYYCPHTKNEYIVVSEMKTIIQEACNILARTTEADTFKYIESESGWDWRSHDYSEGYYIIEYEDERGDTQWFDTRAVSMEEAIGKFCIDTLLPYTNIIDISDETYYIM